jgi:hypothetical protein
MELCNSAWSERMGCCWGQMLVLLVFPVPAVDGTAQLCNGTYSYSVLLHVQGVLHPRCPADSAMACAWMRVCSSIPTLL